MNRITLRNIVAVDTVPLFEGPGVILCDASNPCTNFIIENVTNTMFTGDIDDIIAELPIRAPGVVFPAIYRTDDWEFNYISSNVYGTVGSNVEPSLCLNDVNCFW